MRLSVTVTIMGGLLLGAAAPIWAHHAFAAEFDANKQVELKGVVTKVLWMNPHAHFLLDVKGPDGKVVNWNLELASPSVLVRNGWKRNSLKEGDEVTVKGAQAKDGSPTANAANILFPDGRKLSFLSADQ